MATNAKRLKRLKLLHFKKKPQIQPLKHFPKLGNPNPDHDVKWNYRFIEIVAPGSDAVNKGTTCGEILCVDVDEMECDNGVENAAVERVTEDAGLAKEGNYDPAPQSEVDMDIEVDYVLYRGIFCPWCVVTFSCSGIKINDSITRGNRETLSLEKQIDDIIRIESWHVQCTKSVIVNLIISSKDASQSADACGTSVDDLDLSIYMTHGESLVSNCYVLYAISNHLGGIDVGHYTAFVHNGQQWYEFDDSRVSPVGEDMIKTAAAYFLFYRGVA